MKQLDDKLFPKDFIHKIYIENLGQIISMGYYYIGFGLIGIGIEFLGKCSQCSQNPNWDTPQKGKENIQAAVIDLMKSYEPFISPEFNFAYNLRNGMAHAFKPKGKIELTFRKEASERGWRHKNVNQNGRLVICCEDLYDDFKSACEEVIRRIEQNEFTNPNDKIYKAFIDV